MSAVLWQDEWQAFTPQGWEERSAGLLIADGHFEPLGEGPLAPEVEAPRDQSDDDKDSYLRDEWRAEEREWLQEFREQCREVR